MLAAKSGMTECVNVLLRNGARGDIPNADGYTAVNLAEQAGHADLAKCMRLLPAS
jgi:ankyrin repeat protein